MKTKSFKLIVSLIILLVVSCDEPETVVTNYVHPDGSVTRKIEMKSIDGDVEKRFKKSDIQVPYDETWTVKDSFELDKKGDTIWVKRAVKEYKNVAELNLDYKIDSGAINIFREKPGLKENSGGLTPNSDSRKELIKCCHLATR